jgi:hypothetical protein
MADEAPAATPPATEAAATPGEDTSTADMASFVAELDAAPATETPAETPPEAPAEPEKPADPPAEPAPETPDVRRARQMLEAAGRKEAKALRAIQDDRAKLVARLRQDPDAVLVELGISDGLDGLIDAHSNSRGEKPKTEADRITALESALHAERTARENERLERELDAAKTGVHDRIKADASKYPRVTKDATRLGLVTDLMIAYHEQHGVALPWNTAAQQVEQYLRSLSDDSPLPPPAQPAPRTAPPPASTRPGTVTLKNDDGRAPARGNSAEELDADAAYEAALAEINRM